MSYLPHLAPCALLALLACSGGADSTATDTDKTPTDDGDADTDADSDADTDTDTDTDTGEPIPPAPQLSLFSGAIHPSFGTLIYARWSQTEDADVHVEYSFDDGVWLTSPVRPRTAGEHEELLLGIPYDVEVIWRIVAENPGGSATSPDQALTTRELPSSIPAVVVRVEDPQRMDPDTQYVYVSMTAEGDGFGSEWWILIIDRKGRPVWATQSASGTMSMHPRISWDGTALLVDQNVWWSQFNRYAGSVEKIRIDGTVVTTWETPGLHHPFQEMPDGSLAWGGWTGSYDEALQIVHPDGSQETLWDCDQFLIDIGVEDSCASNTLNYDEASNTFLYSFFTFETVIEIDATTGEPNRWFGHLPGAYSFDPPQSTFFYQHGAHFTDSGTLLLSAHTSDNTDELVIREYEVDAGSETLHEVFNFGVGLGVTGADMGDAYKLPNGNILHNHGSNPRLREVTPSGELVWDLEWPTDNIGRSTALTELYSLAPEPE